LLCGGIFEALDGFALHALAGASLIVLKTNIAHLLFLQEKGLV